MQAAVPHLRPEQHSGKTILRPIDYSGPTPKLASSAVFHPPAVQIVYSLENMAEDEAKAIVSMKAMTASELRARLFTFARRVIENNRMIENG
jgi:hypothetical protein